MTVQTNAIGLASFGKFQKTARLAHCFVIFPTVNGKFCWVIPWVPQFVFVYNKFIPCYTFGKEMVWYELVHRIVLTCKIFVSCVRICFLTFFYEFAFYFVIIGNVSVFIHDWSGNSPLWFKYTVGFNKSCITYVAMFGTRTYFSARSITRVYWSEFGMVIFVNKVYILHQRICPTGCVKHSWENPEVGSLFYEVRQRCITHIYNSVYGMNISVWYFVVFWNQVWFVVYNDICLASNAIIVKAYL